MSSLKNVYNDLYADALCMVGCDNSIVCELVNEGCECFLECYRTETYKASYQYAYYRMLKKYRISCEN